MPFCPGDAGFQPYHHLQAGVGERDDLGPPISGIRPTLDQPEQLHLMGDEHKMVQAVAAKVVTVAMASML